MKAQNGGQQELLPAGERIDDAPQWFVNALANKPQDKAVSYEQTELHYRQWTGPM